MGAGGRRRDGQDIDAARVLRRVRHVERPKATVAQDVLTCPAGHVRTQVAMDETTTNRRDKRDRMYKYVPGSCVRYARIPRRACLSSSPRGALRREMWRKARAVREAGFYWWSHRYKKRLGRATNRELAALVGVDACKNGVELSVKDISMVLPPPVSRIFLRKLRDELRE